jgi:hypothetical protein
MSAEQKHTPGRQTIVRYLEMRRRRPLVGLDSVIHAIHTGTPFAASVSIEDLATIVDRHDELLAACRSAEIKLARYMEIHGPKAPEGSRGTYVGGLSAEYEASLAIIRTAIAKATGAQS